MSGELILRSPADATSQKQSAPLVEFNEEVDHFLDQIQNNSDLLVDDAVDSIERAFKFSKAWWLFPPAAGWIATKKYLDRRKFRRLVRLVFMHIVNPRTPLHAINNPIEIVGLAKVKGIDVTKELAEEILALMPSILRQSAITPHLHTPNLGRYLQVVEQRLSAARLERKGAGLEVVRSLISDSYAAAMIDALRPGPIAIEDVLANIATACSLSLNEHHRLDANLMMTECDKESVRNRCFQNQAAVEHFGNLFDPAPDVLVVRHTTNQSYKNFWLPFFSDAKRDLPGAPDACRDVSPQVVFTRHLHPFGAKLDEVAEGAVDKVVEYLGGVKFLLFFSFPVANTHGALGVVNVNVYRDEIKFYDVQELQQLYETVRPFLALLTELLQPPPLAIPA